jgi:hypothetical protein
MMGYIIKGETLFDLKNVPVGHVTVTGSRSCISVESSCQDLSNDTSHDGV